MNFEFIFGVIFLFGQIGCECGQPPLDKIVGGKEARKHQFPYQLKLETGNSLCGASLLTPRIALTAAHCVMNIDKNILKVTAGDHLLNKKENSEQVSGVQEVRIHEDFNPTRGFNDIAILVLASPFKTNNKSVTTIPLAPAGYEASGSAIVSGWGAISASSSQASNVLLYANASIITDEECAKYHGGIIPSMLCAGEEGLGSCHGDSGGPLVATNGHLIGVVSFGSKQLGCAKIPAVFTEVSKLHKWITKNSA